MPQGLVRATITDSSGQLVADATHNVSFSILQGPGKIIGSHAGNPIDHEPNQSPWHSAYHGLVRGLVKVTMDAASPLWHRERLRQIDVDSGSLTTIVDGDCDGVPPSIVIQATAPGLTPATLSIPTSHDAASAGVLPVAAASAGEPVLVH